MTEPKIKIINTKPLPGSEAEPLKANVKKTRRRKINRVPVKGEENRRAFLNNIKRRRGCSFCEETDPCCLDFHHLDPADKKFTIAAGISKETWNNVLDEVEKCIVICKNCHSKLHRDMNLERKSFST